MNEIDDYSQPKRKHPDKTLAAQGHTVPATVTFDFKPVRRLVCRAVRADRDMALPNNNHGLQRVKEGDYVVQDERGEVHAMPERQFLQQFRFVDEGAPFAEEEPADDDTKPTAAAATRQAVRL